MSRWCSVELVIITYFTLSSQERVCRESLVSRSLSCETPSRLSLKQKLARARIRIGLMIIGGSLPKYIKTVNSRVNVETVALIPTHVARKLVFHQCTQIKRFTGMIDGVACSKNEMRWSEWFNGDLHHHHHHLSPSLPHSTSEQSFSSIV